MPKNHDAALSEAVDAIGGVVVTASLCHVKPQAVSQWHRCPAKHAEIISRKSGVPKSRLRPDLWPPRARKAAA
jgi:DNA-binding transcriptional regulator YdaS (Cro superfamily)